MEEMWKQLKDNALAATICCAGPFRFRTLEEDTFLESVAAADGRIVRHFHPRKSPVGCLLLRSPVQVNATGDAGYYSTCSVLRG